MKSRIWCGRLQPYVHASSLGASPVIAPMHSSARLSAAASARQSRHATIARVVRHYTTPAAHCTMTTCLRLRKTVSANNTAARLPYSRVSTSPKVLAVAISSTTNIMTTPRAPAVLHAIPLQPLTVITSRSAVSVPRRCNENIARTGLLGWKPRRPTNNCRHFSMHAWQRPRHVIESSLTSSA